jgi:membrane protease subunit (stomatin/prohibitin family)
MSILDKVVDFAKSQFIEVIEWLDDTGNTMLYRFPVQGQEIKNGAQLIVRASQAAVFVHEGQIGDVFGPGRYTIDGGNTPVLSKIGAWKYGFNSPFKAEVYFVNTKMFNDLKWGTMNTVMRRDTDFVLDAMCTSGIYTIRVSDPGAFVKEVAGTNAHFETDDIEGQLKRSLVSGFTDALGESKIAALDLAANYDELSKIAKDKMSADFKTFGLELSKFFVENISLPPEVEAAMDKRTSMGVLGDAQRYAQFQAADAMVEAAKNPSGGAGLGAGLGAGFAVGGAMANAMGGALNQGQGQGQSQGGGAAAATVKCPSCQANNLPEAKFCNDCGAKMQVAMVPCIKCGAQLREGAKFCADCGSSQQKAKCANCQHELNPGQKFCNECGTKVE